MATIINPSATTGTASKYILSTYYDKVFMARLTPAVKWGELCENRDLPQHQGKIVKFSAFKQLAKGTRLTEGTSPTPKVLSSYNVTATLFQFGDHVGVTDLMEMTGITSTVKQAVGVMADQAAATIDEQISHAAFGGIGILPSATSNISAQLRGRYTGSVSTLSALHLKVAGFTIRLSRQCSALLAATGRLSAVILHATSAYNAASKITLRDVADAVASLRTRNVQPFTNDGYYLGIAHPALLLDLRSDTATGGWIDWQKYTRPKETMMKGEVGECEGVRILASSQALDRAVNRGCQVSATIMTIVGKGALGFVDYGKSYDATGKSYIIMQEGGTIYDPLEQIAGTVGWKCTMAAAVLNTSCGIHLFGLRNVNIS